MSQLLLFNKPYGVVCQFTGSPEEKTLADFIQMPGFYAAGRLDKNSEGLLLLTNDGALQHRLSHPRFNKKKYYWVQVEGIPSEQDLFPLRKGLKIQNLQFLPAKVKRIEAPEIWTRNPPVRFRRSIPTSWLEMILEEGKNHQIRKMTAAIGFPTLRLIRHRIDRWSLNGLEPGQQRLVSLE
ncbi:pseudouridine synthase [Legionella impletisoli]|uniref:Pseudouridine synthase n=1 Tax=Legionella impletisoli TaxID=343510 RepID=A0A917NAS3_9GAMM|nr:pseudouridine synthase [Legionella impletisoli]GGI84294.1 pseudouridine synthase [Legionella impletisoli]